MGSNCSSVTNNIPCENNMCNKCNVDVGEYPNQRMENFCTLEGIGGKSKREEYCRKMSSAGEWKVGKDSQDGLCSYNDCRNYQEIGFGCCKGCCGLAGKGLKCQRVSFTGDPVRCCFNNYNCVTDPTDDTKCFSDIKQQNTCANGKNGQKNYRDISSLDCKDILEQYCTGTLPSDDPTSVEWLTRWNNPNLCPDAIARNLSADPCNPSPPPPVGVCNISPENLSSDGYFWAQKVVGEAIARYAEQGFILGTLPGQVGYNPFQDFLYANVCCPYPGICQSGLKKACATFTAQRISLNPSIAQWCGCHLPADEYQQYSVKYNIPPQCSPTCNRVGTIPIVGINGDPINCEQTTCIMDGITLNLINTQAAGGINFNQACNNCPGGVCSCIISDITIDLANSTIGNNFSVQEGCNFYTCYQTNPGDTGPSQLVVPCGTTAGYNPYAEYDNAVRAAQTSAYQTSFFWTMVVIGVCLLFIFFIILFIHPSFNPSKTLTIPRTKPDINREFSRNTNTYSSINGESQNTDFLPYSNDYSSIRNTSTSSSTDSSTFTSILNR
jgi:hypothetical protein